MNGKAVVKCIVCKKPVNVPVPETWWIAFTKETSQTLRLYGSSLQAMGWLTVLGLGVFWIGGWYLMSYVFKWPSWISILIPAIPFIYVFSRHFAPRMQAQVRGDLGVLRAPRGLRGMSEKDPLPIKKLGEAQRLARNRACIQCGGNYQAGEDVLVLPNRGTARMRFQFTGKTSKMFERVEVTCQQCGNHGFFYFDISAVDLVRKYGYTRELTRVYPQKTSRSQN